MGDVPIEVLGLRGDLLLQSPNPTILLGESQIFLYLERVGMNYWVVPIIIRKKEKFWETGVLFSYQLSQYRSWIRDWGTAGDALSWMSTCHYIVS